MSICNYGIEIFGFSPLLLCILATEKMLVDKYSCALLHTHLSLISPCDKHMWLFLEAYFWMFNFMYDKALDSVFWRVIKDDVLGRLVYTEFLWVSSYNIWPSCHILRKVSYVLWGMAWKNNKFNNMRHKHQSKAGSQSIHQIVFLSICYGQTY